MSYYIRAFCTHGGLPPLRSILETVAERGTQPTFDPAISGPTDLEDSRWTEVAIEYKPNKSPISFEVSYPGEPGDYLFGEEIAEFLQELEDAPRNRHRRFVEKHLKNTRFIVAARLPTSDIDDDGLAVLEFVLNFLVDYSGAIIQADGEGFYKGRKLIVELQ